MEEHKNLKYGTDKEEREEEAEEFAEEIENQTPKEEKKDEKKIVKNLLEHTKEKKKPLTKLYEDSGKVNSKEIEELTNEIRKEVANKKDKINKKLKSARENK